MLKVARTLSYHILSIECSNCIGTIMIPMYEIIGFFMYEIIGFFNIGNTTSKSNQRLQKKITSKEQ